MPPHADKKMPAGNANSTADRAIVTAAHCIKKLPGFDTGAAHGKIRDKAKAPVLENTKPEAVAAPTEKRGIVMPEILGCGLARTRMVSGGMGLPVRMAARLRACFQHPAHPLRLKTQTVVFLDSPEGTKTMPQAALPLVRLAAPGIASNDASPPTYPDAMRLRALAVNSLAEALRVLRTSDLAPQDLSRAIARANRGLTNIKRLASLGVR